MTNVEKNIDDVVTLTRREAAALDRAAVDSLLLAAGLEQDEIVVVRRKLRHLATMGHAKENLTR